MLSASHLFCACSQDPSLEPNTPRSDADIILEAKRYTQEFQQINQAPLPSVHQDDITVNTWANERSEALFRSIPTMENDPDAQFDPGSFLLKEHFDANDTLVMYTLMYKQPPGYSPVSHDWWWAKLDSNFEVIEGVVGKGPEITSCYDCHDSATDVDFAIGVALADQTP